MYITVLQVRTNFYLSIPLENISLHVYVILAGKGGKDDGKALFLEEQLAFLSRKKRPEARRDNTKMCSLAWEVTNWLPPFLRDCCAVATKSLYPQALHWRMYQRGSVFLIKQQLHAEVKLNSKEVNFTAFFFCLQNKVLEPSPGDYCRHAVGPW